MPEFSQIKDLWVLVMEESNYGMLHKCNSANCLVVGAPMAIIAVGSSNARICKDFCYIGGHNLKSRLIT